MSSLTTGRPLLDEDYQRLLAFRSQLRDFLRWSEQAAQERRSDTIAAPAAAGSTRPPRPARADDRTGRRGAAHTPPARDAVELTQRAETAGLICRERDPIDHRRVHLKLSSHGREQLEALTRQHLGRIPSLAESLERVLHARDGANAPAPDLHHAPTECYSRLIHGYGPAGGERTTSGRPLQSVPERCHIARGTRRRHPADPRRIVEEVMGRPRVCARRAPAARTRGSPPRSTERPRAPRAGHGLRVAHRGRGAARAAAIQEAGLRRGGSRRGRGACG